MSLIEGGALIPAHSTFLPHYANRRRVRCNDLFVYMVRVSSSFLVLLIVVLTAVPAMFGQAYFGTVSGELTDATGAVVTGAKVVLTDQEKGFSFQHDLRQQRTISVPLDPSGSVHVVSVEAKGFDKTAKRQVQGRRQRECDRKPDA